MKKQTFLELRNELGLTQKRMAEELGMQQAGYARMEMGDNKETRTYKVSEARRQKMIKLVSNKNAGTSLSLESNPLPEITSPEIEGRDHNEIARAAIAGPTPSLDTVGLRHRTSSLSGREYERLRRLQPRLKTAMRIIEDATFWIPGKVIAGNNNYEKFPKFEARDELLVPMVTNQFDSMLHEYSPFMQSMRSFLTMAMTI